MVCCIARWCFKVMLWLEEFFELGCASVDWCAVIQQWCGWMGLLLEFVHEVFTDGS